MTFFTKLTNLYTEILDFLLPISPIEAKFRNISPEEFSSKAKRCPPSSSKEIQALFTYQDPMVKNVIWLLKYKNNKHAAEILGSALANELDEWLQDLLAFENFKNPLLVPVPMSEERKKQRGGNHTEKLCEVIILALPENTAEYSIKAMSKTRSTESQAKTKGRAARLQNLSGSFRADSKIVFDRNIVLIDDVITTGATIEECRKTLEEAGAKKVIVLTVAH